MKYENLMAGFNVKIDDPVLDPAFVQKVKDFQQKLENKQLTDDEIEAGDNELCELFNTLHSFTEEESPEVKKANHKAEIANAKVEVTEAQTIEQLNDLANKFIHLPDIQIIIENKIERISKEQGESKRQKFLADSLEQIKVATLEELSTLANKFEEYPELVELIQRRIADEKPPEPKKEKREKLLQKKDWDYKSLKEIGISPTGEQDMIIEGVKLQRPYLFKIYSVIEVDGKKVRF